MNIPIWLDRYCTDSKLKYPSERTQENYQSSVKSFLYKFKDIKEPLLSEKEGLYDNNILKQGI